MENENMIEKLAGLLGQHATVKNVYGEPIITQDKTIIPVARVAFGLGGGRGQKFIKNKIADLSGTEKELPVKGEGAGGGGGMYASPIGVYEITQQGTRFISAHQTRHMIVAALIGFCIKGLFFSKKK